MIGFWTLIGCAALFSHAKAEELLPGPIPAEPIAVVDGDTVEVRAQIWPGHSVRTRVRLRGVDAPEIFRPACPAERALGEAAARFVEAWTREETLMLREVSLGSFAGRVVARIGRGDGGDLSDALIAGGLGAPYGVRNSWCADADAAQ